SSRALAGAIGSSKACASKRSFSSASSWPGRKATSSACSTAASSSANVASSSFWSAGLTCELLFERSDGAVQHDVEGCGRNLERARTFFPRSFLDYPQRECACVARVQAADQLDHPLSSHRQIM